MRKVGIDADRSHMGQVGIGLVELVDLFRHGQNTFVCVGGVETGEFHAAEKEFLDLLVVVLRHLLSDDLLDGGFHLCLVDIAVVFVQCLLIFVFFRLVAFTAVLYFRLQAARLYGGLDVFCVCHVSMIYVL